MTTKRYPRIITKLQNALYGTMAAILEEYGVEDISDIKGVIYANDVHQYMADCDALVIDDETLLFFDGIKSAEKFLYYMGAEKEATLQAFYKGMAIYSGISESRIAGKMQPLESGNGSN